MESANIPVRWADMDAYQHVNNAVYLNYLEEARDKVMEKLFGEQSYDFVTARVEIDFRNEITQADGVITVRSRVSGHGRSSVRSREVIVKADGTVAAEAAAVVVPRNSETGGSRPLREDEVARIDAEMASDASAGHDF